MIFPLRWTGGFQRTSRCEEELDVEMTSWGTVGAMIGKRGMLRGGAPSKHGVIMSPALWIHPPFPEGSICDFQPSFPRNHSVLSLFQKLGYR